MAAVQAGGLDPGVGNTSRHHAAACSPGGYAGWSETVGQSDAQPEVSGTGPTSKNSVHLRCVPRDRDVVPATDSESSCALSFLLAKEQL